MKQLIKDGLRRCYRCKEIKPCTFEHFRKSKKHAAGLDYICKPCANEYTKEWYWKNGGWGKYSERHKILDIMGKQCAKCKVKHENPTFFDIDHIKPLRQGRGRRRYKITEIKNYMVLCPNCHRLKTIKENGFI